jgi:hypothetical protein
MRDLSGGYAVPVPGPAVPGIALDIGCQVACLAAKTAAWVRLVRPSLPSTDDT